MAVDRGWNLVASNSALGPLLEGASDELLQPPVNCLRLCLHPQGIAPRILNLGEWRVHLIRRVQRQIALTGDPQLRSLLGELLEYPAPPPPDHESGGEEVMVKLRMSSDDGELEFFSTVTTFGTAVDITVSELSIEAFFPADARTAEALTALAAIAAVA